MESNWLEVILGEDEQRPHLNTFSSCMTLCDVKCDNYVRLVAAHISLEREPLAHLRVFRGLKQASDLKLEGIPAAIESFYVDEKEPKTSVIAVAIAESILFYRNLKPYFKYTVPELEVEDLEEEIWRKLPVVREENHQSLIESLQTIDRPKLTRKSQKLLLLQPTEREDFIAEHKDSPLTRYASIVAMRALPRASSDANPPSYLVVATDNGDIFILEPHGFSIIYKAKSCSYATTPSLLTVHGTFEMDFCMVIAARNGAIYFLRKSTTVGQEIIKLMEPLTGLILLSIDQTIAVVTMDQRLVCYSKKGKQLHTTKLKTMPVCMIPLTLPHLGLTLICVALEGGVVQFYMQRHLVDEFKMPASVTAMVFGRMGIEDHVLTLITTENELHVKILRRVAVFEPGRMQDPQKKAKQKTVETSILDKVKKSSIFVEQANREKQNPKVAYASFQKELMRLRLTAARAIVEVMNASEGATDITHAPVRIEAEVVGSGPDFRLYLTIQNLSSYKMAANLTVLLHADRRHYSMPKSIAKLPSILPGVPLKIDFEVTAVIEPYDKLPPPTLTPENSRIRAFLVKPQQTKPVIAAVIEMPQLVNIPADLQISEC